MRDPRQPRDTAAARAAGHRAGRRRPRTLAAALVAATLLATACGGQDDMTSSDSSDWGGAAPMPDAAFEERAAQEPSMAPAPGMDTATGTVGDGQVVDGSGTSGAGDVTKGRAIIRSAYLVLEVADGAAAIDAVGTLATEVGGYVATTALSRGADGTVSGTLTLRVPSARLDEVVERLDDLAVAVPTRNVDEYDVTSQLTDIDARLTNLRLFEDELRALLTEVRERSDGAAELVTILDQLRQVRTEIEATEAWRTTLTDQVALSSVTVTIVPATSGVPIGPATWRPSDTVRTALTATVRAATRVVDGIIWTVLTLLPVALLVLVPLAGLVAWRRAVRRRRSRSAALDVPGGARTDERAEDTDGTP
jgi:hypothetical protein